MTPTKLTDTEKQEILELYQQPEETTITLAKRYGVSSSTVRRILQNGYSEAEYEMIVQQKRVAKPAGNLSLFPLRCTSEESESERRSSPVSVLTEEVETPDGKRRRRRITTPDLLPAETSPDYQPSRSQFKDLLGDEIFDEDEDEDFDPDEEEDLEDFDEDEDEDALLEDLEARYGAFVQPVAAQVQILPLSHASLPKICYLVVDRTTELVTKPLKFFNQLGQIPLEEVQEMTLPVFDNHRVARRFSARNQRVIKVPDGRMIQKVAGCLKAKGISRLLVDGQVYRV